MDEDLYALQRSANVASEAIARFLDKLHDVEDFHEDYELFIAAGAASFCWNALIETLVEHIGGNVVDVELDEFINMRRIANDAAQNN